MSEQQHSEQRPVEQPKKDKEHHYGTHIADRISQQQENELNRQDQQDALDRIKQGRIHKGSKIA